MKNQEQKLSFFGQPLGARWWWMDVERLTGAINGGHLNLHWIVSSGFFAKIENHFGPQLNKLLGTNFSHLTVWALAPTPRTRLSLAGLPSMM